MPQRSADDAVELETPVLDVEDGRPEVGVDPARVEELVVPYDDWVLLRMEPPTRSSRGGILIGDKSVPESRIGVVVRQGEGFLMPNGVDRLPMLAAVGDRVLFERRAGKTMPRVPDETDPRTGQVGYLLVRNGSLVCGLGRRVGRDGKPAPLAPRDVTPFADWTLVRTDRPVAQTDPTRPRRSGVAAPTLLLPESQRASQRHMSSSWSGTVVKQGPGRVSEDGKVVARPRCRVGERILFLGSELSQTVPGIDGHLLVLEREVVLARLGAAAAP